MPHPLIPTSIQSKLKNNPHYRKRQALRAEAQRNGKTVSPKLDPLTQQPLGK